MDGEKSQPVDLERKIRGRVVERKEIRSRTWKSTNQVYTREGTASREKRVRTQEPELVRVEET